MKTFYEMKKSIKKLYRHPFSPQFQKNKYMPGIVLVRKKIYMNFFLVKNNEKSLPKKFEKFWS